MKVCTYAREVNISGYGQDVKLCCVCEFSTLTIDDFVTFPGAMNVTRDSDNLLEFLLLVAISHRNFSFPR